MEMNYIFKKRFYEEISQTQLDKTNILSLRRNISRNREAYSMQVKTHPKS